MNLNREVLFSHTLPNSTKHCPEWNGFYEFKVISISPKQRVPIPPITPPPPPSAAQLANTNQDSLKDYPDETKHSVRARPAGFYGGGKNRKH